MEDTKKVYGLYNQDVPICDFILDLKSNEIVDIVKEYDIDYAPVEIVPFHLLNLKRLQKWFDSRAIPLERNGLDDFLKEIDEKNNSLSDQYWFKPIELELNWDEVNFFDNPYNSIELTNAVFGKNTSLNKTFLLSSSHLKTPNASLGGLLQKMWIKDELSNQHYLVKSSNTIYNLEPLNEVIASKVCEILELPHASYRLMKIEGKRTRKLVSVCNDLVDKNHEIVSAASLIEGFPEFKIDDYESYKSFVQVELGIANAKEMIEKMLILDFFMLNEDRHLANFGVIRNSKTLRWESVCPIYDTGRSFNTTINEDYWNYEDGDVRLFDGSFVSASLLIPFFKDTLKTLSLTQIDKIKAIPELFIQELNKYKSFFPLNDDQINKIKQGILLRTQILEKEWNKVK